MKLLCVWSGAALCLLAGDSVPDEILPRDAASTASRLELLESERLGDVRHDGFFWNQQWLAYARLNHYERVVMLIAAQPGATAGVVREIETRGGVVLSRYDEVDFLRAILPLEIADEPAMLPGVSEWVIDSGRALPPGPPRVVTAMAGGSAPPSGAVRPPAAPVVAMPAQPVARDLPDLPLALLTEADSPLLPGRDLAAEAFHRAQGPAASRGAGITIAVFEGDRGESIDYSLPRFRAVRTVDGRRITAVAGQIDVAARIAALRPPPTDVLWAVGPDGESRPEARVRQTIEQAQCADEQGHIQIDAIEYTTPRGGCFHGGMAKVHDRTAATLWNDEGEVWIDTDGDHDLRDETALIDIDAAAQQGIAVPVASMQATYKGYEGSLSVAVAFNGERVPTLYPGTAGHHVMTASSALGLAADARVLIVRAADTGGENLEGVLLMLRDPRVDMVSMSTLWTGVGQGPVLPVFRRVLARAMRHYKKPFLLGANNMGPASQSVTAGQFAIWAGIPGAAQIGSYASQGNVTAVSGLPFNRDVVQPYSVRGPALNGALAPDFVAPASTLTDMPCFFTEARRRTAGAFRLPPCMAIGGGTSNATPVAASATAVLLGAAKAAGIPRDAERIVWALRAGAAHVDGIGVHEQGHGLMQLDAAWRALWSVREVAELPRITTTGRARVPWGDGAGTLEGPGIFEREGWRPGNKGLRRVTLLRRGGAKRAQSYGLQWIGNDSGTFQVSRRTVGLARDVPVTIDVSIAPTTRGTHSALLAIVDPALGERHESGTAQAGWPVAWIPMTVFASQPLDASMAFEINESIEQPWLDGRVTQVTLSEELAALRLRLQMVGTEPESQMLGLGLPYRGVVGGNSDSAPSLLLLPRSGKRLVKLIPQPPAGVWEVPVTRDGVSPNPEIDVLKTGRRYELSLAALRVTGEAQTAERGLSVQWTNRGARLDGALTRIAIGARRELPTTLKAGEPTQVEIQVAPGTTGLRVGFALTEQSIQDATLSKRAAANTRASTPVFLFLYDCTTGRCYAVSDVRNGRSHGLLTVRKPAPGRWVAVLVSEGAVSSVSESSVALTYSDVLEHPLYGEVTQDDAMPSARAVGATWTVRATLSRAPEDVPADRRAVIVAEVIDEPSEREAAQSLDGFSQLSRTHVSPIALGRVMLPYEPALETSRR